MKSFQRVEKLAIGYPWASPFIWSPFTINLANLERPPNSRIFEGRGWCPGKRHIHICDQAIEFGASHILIIGADQLHPIDMIPRLIKRIEEDDCEVISALVPTRGHIPRQKMKPFQPMAWRLTGKGPGDFRVIDIKDGPLQRVDFIGSGVIMFPVDDLLAITKPWFKETFDVPTMGRIAAMDTKFVWELKKECGAQTWVDTTIKVKHLSTFAIDDTYSERFADYGKLAEGELKVIDFDKIDELSDYLKKEAIF